MSDPTEKLKVKTVQFAIGVDLLGSKLTLSSKNGNELTDVGNAVVAVSRTSNRFLKIPYPNIKGIEYFAPSAKPKKEPETK